VDETYGAAAERVEVTMHDGDWIVFNVANNRMRWNGSHYFAAAGMMDEGSPSFWSESSSGRWVACEDPSEVRDFIARATTGLENKAVAITDQKWGGGDERMEKFTGGWKGEGIWSSGNARNIWVKYLVAAPRPPKSTAGPTAARPAGPATGPSSLFGTP
jgi:hypothetical protein